MKNFCEVRALKIFDHRNKIEGSCKTARARAVLKRARGNKSLYATEIDLPNFLTASGDRVKPRPGS